MWQSYDWSQDFSILSNIQGAFTHDLRITLFVINSIG